jgi:hypothetical protein
VVININGGAADGSLICPTDHSLPLSSLKNGIQQLWKAKLEEEAESSMVRKRL